MKKLYVVGIGPGGLEHMSIKAREVIEQCEVVVGYTKYIKMVESLLEGKEVHSTGMMGEEERCKKAIEIAQDKTVAVISTGDAGIYGMAGLILQLCNDANVEIVPGITASSSAGSVLGAPLMHDNCNISLSDLMTPYELIKKRVRLAADGDFVISLYNPRSKGRPNYLRECLDVISEYRDGNTPIGIVKHALRDGQEITVTTLKDIDVEIVDMMSIVVIGNSQSYIENGRFITPRGYNVC